MVDHLGPVMLAALASRRRMLATIAEPLARADVSNDAAFADCVAGLIAVGIEPRRIALDAKVSIPTVDRWSRGVSSPHPLMRTSIKIVLIRIIRDEIALIDAIYAQPEAADAAAG